jgi:hypothetical protein
VNQAERQQRSAALFEEAPSIDAVAKKPFAHF